MNSVFVFENSNNFATRHWSLLGFICIKTLFALDKLLKEYFLERINNISEHDKRLPKFEFRENKEWWQPLKTFIFALFVL